MANFLMRHEQRDGGGQIFDPPFDKHRLVAFLGMTPESLSRAFRSPQNYGVIVDGARVTINDRADPRNFAKPDALIDDPTT